MISIQAFLCLAVVTVYLCGFSSSQSSVVDVCRSRCAKFYSPICGSDGRTYNNRCYLRNAIKCESRSLEEAHEGRCKPRRKCTKIRCTYEFSPVCGTDGNTYSNRCIMRHKSRCINKVLEVAHTGICKKVRPQPCPRACATEYDLICGSDGKTYYNECELKKAIECKKLNVTKAYMGGCKRVSKLCSTTCSSRSDPVCGTNGKTYNSECELQKDKKCNDRSVKRAYRGRCIATRKPCTVACHYLYDPVCGNDGVTYDNDCELKKAKECKGRNSKLAYRGKCKATPKPCNIACPYLYDPVCGNDGVTYDNECEVNKARECKGRNSKIAYRGQCRVTPKPCTIACPYLYEPVCGNDGISYDNECELNKAKECKGRNIKIEYKGKCSDSDVICTQPKATGRCRGKFPKWYYDANDGTCKKFVYGGCPTKGNKNRFDLKSECNKFCKKYKNGRKRSSIALDKNKEGRKQGPIVLVKAKSCPKVCNYLYEPVCASNRKTYSNPCIFANAKECQNLQITISYYGVCADKPHRCNTACAYNYEPLCASNNKTYDNLCKLREAIECNKMVITLKHHGKCGVRPKLCKSVCPALWNPVCATNRKTYSNMCHLRQAIQCKSVRTREQSRGVCRRVPGIRSCGKACPMISDPVCANNGKTYPNKCAMDGDAKCKGLMLTMLHHGKCRKNPCRKGCEYVMDPVCGSNGKTYSNKCVFQNAKNCDDRSLTIAHQGKCKPNCPKRCGSNLYDPICGSDKKTYTNKCLFDDAVQCQLLRITKRHNGACEANCPKRCGVNLYEPICGSDGNTYTNKCLFDDAVKCQFLRITKRHNGACEANCPKRCGQNLYDPICGSDGNTYTNKCLFDDAVKCQLKEITKRHNGACEANCPKRCGENLYDPICGSDGNTYTNKCLFDDAVKCQLLGITKRHDGACEANCPKRCGENLYEPICGSDGNTYTNKCLFDDAVKCQFLGITKRHNGACEANCPKRCRSNNFDPICGSDGITYNNKCLFDDAVKCQLLGITKKHNGICRDKCPRPCRINKYNPICASDGKTYTNKCVFEDAVYCKKLKIKRLYYGKCTGVPQISPKMLCPKPCTLENEPICGSDGKTYSNKCTFKNALECDNLKITKVHDGECKAKCPRRCRSNNYNPICGSDGKTYNNKCNFEDAVFCRKLGIKRLHYGECRAKCPRPCRRNNYNPICGSDGKTYTNKCVFEDAVYCKKLGIKRLHYGECRGVPRISTKICPKPCTLEYEPICGSDGKTYSNKCSFKNALECENRKITKVHDGECKGVPRISAKKLCPKLCTREYEPICGSDNKTYSNKCVFKDAVECKNRKITKVHDGKCKPQNTKKCPKACLYKYEPICATDGTTYMNKCLFQDAVNCKNKKIKQLHLGECGARDVICTQPKATGKCRGNFPKWYYDANDGICKTFVYGGCPTHGNKNRFDVKSDCNKFCNYAKCSLPMEKGVCSAYDPRWFFDAKTGKCKLFNYGGCFGNANNFLSKNNCKQSCDRCILPPIRGDCRGYYQKFYYDPVEKKCKAFIYSGCKGNANKFDTRDRCLDTCGR